MRMNVQAYQVTTVANMSHRNLLGINSGALCRVTNSIDTEVVGDGKFWQGTILTTMSSSVTLGCRLFTVILVPSKGLRTGCHRQECYQKAENSCAQQQHSLWASDLEAPLPSETSAPIMPPPHAKGWSLPGVYASAWNATPTSTPTRSAFPAAPSGLRGALLSAPAAL